MALNGFKNDCSRIDLNVQVQSRKCGKNIGSILFIPIFFLLQRISGALISQSSIDSLFPVLLIFLLADSSADEARARVLKVEVGEELTDREDFEGLLVLLQLVKL